MIEIHETIAQFRLKLSEQTPGGDVLKLFTTIIYNYYAAHRRPFVWRNHIDPYHVVVSEIMLQQTQTKRVEQKFPEFITRFPSFEKLASASLHEVLTAWTGLGYNRRGIALHKISQLITNSYQGTVPDEPAVLETFPGIGPASASSIIAFAYNKPTLFIETNIRSVFIHFFFENQQAVSDKIILEMVEKTLDRSNPREWYYALMDYGVLLKTLYPNPSRKSKHYTKQSKFEGSNRQLRSIILQTILKNPEISIRELIKKVAHEPLRIEKNVADLEKEGFVVKIAGKLRIP